MRILSCILILKQQEVNGEIKTAVFADTPRGTLWLEMINYLCASFRTNPTASI